MPFSTRFFIPAFALPNLPVLLKQFLDGDFILVGVLVAVLVGGRRCVELAKWLEQFLLTKELFSSNMILNKYG